MCRSSKAKNETLRIMNSETELIVFDVETTGFSSTNDRVIQFSGIKYVISNGILTEKDRFDTYINPEILLPSKITEITGITDELLSAAPVESEVFSKIHTFLGDTPNICGQNISFDIRFVTAMYERYGYSFSPVAILDTLEMAKDIVDSKECENRKLGTLAKHFSVDYGLTFHNSMDDVIACSRLLLVFFEKYKEKEAEISNVYDETKTTVVVTSLRYWPGLRGRSRIYVLTDCGDFFYDILGKTWGTGKTCFQNIETIDMERLKADAFRLANVTTERDFARFRG